MYLGYVSRHEHTLVGTRLYMPKERTKGKTRIKKEVVPRKIKFGMPDQTPQFPR
jgi:hypothetical protein